MSRASDRCECGHVRGTHHYGRQWMGCKRWIRETQEFCGCTRFEPKEADKIHIKFLSKKTRFFPLIPYRIKIAQKTIYTQKRR